MASLTGMCVCAVTNGHALPLLQVSEVRQFLLTNLVEAEGRYVWRVNLEAISRHMANIMGFPVFHAPYPGPTLFLAGSDSPYVR